MPHKNKFNRPGEPVNVGSSDPYMLVLGALLFILFTAFCFYLAFSQVD